MNESSQNLYDLINDAYYRADGKVKYHLGEAKRTLKKGGVRMKESIECGKDICGEEATYQTTTPEGIKSYECPRGHKTGIRTKER